MELANYLKHEKLAEIEAKWDAAWDAAGPIFPQPTSDLAGAF